MGHIALLLRHAGRSVPHDIRPAALQHRPRPRRRGHRVGSHLHAHCRRDNTPGPLRAALLPRVRGEYHPHRLHVHCLRILHAVGAVAAAELVVLINGDLHHHRRVAELRLCADYQRRIEKVAVHLPARGITDVSVWAVLLRHAEFARVGVVSHLGGEIRGGGAVETWTDGCAVYEVQGIAAEGSYARCQDLADCIDDGVCIHGQRRR